MCGYVPPLVQLSKMNDSNEISRIGTPEVKGEAESLKILS